MGGLTFLYQKVLAQNHQHKRFVIMDEYMKMLHYRRLWLMPFAVLLFLLMGIATHTTGVYAFHGQKTSETSTRCQNTCPVLQTSSKEQETGVKEDIDPESGPAMPYYTYFVGIAYLLPVVFGAYVLSMLVRRPPDLVRLYVRYQN